MEIVSSPPAVSSPPVDDFMPKVGDRIRSRLNGRRGTLIAERTGDRGSGFWARMDEFDPRTGTDNEQLYSDEFDVLI